MRRLLLQSPAFGRDLKKWLKSHSDTADSIAKTLEQLSADASHAFGISGLASKELKQHIQRREMESLHMGASFSPCYHDQFRNPISIGAPRLFSVD